MSGPYIACKWPGLLVNGAKVTKEQAAEILVRTNIWPCSSNNDKYDKLFNKIAGITGENEGGTYREYIEQLDAISKRLNLVDVCYFRNEMLTSCYILGPRGWCDWDGNIRANNFNIGKWPSIEEVTEELELIARAFPYLDMEVQTLSGEICSEDELYPTAMWAVKDGHAKLYDYIPTEIMKVDGGYSNIDNINIWDVGATEEQVRLGVELAMRSTQTKQVQ